MNYFLRSKKIQLSSFIKGKQNNLSQSIALMQDPSDVYSYRQRLALSKHKRKCSKNCKQLTRRKNGAKQQCIRRLGIANLLKAPWIEKNRQYSLCGAEMHRSGYFHVSGTGCSLVLQKDLEYWTIGNIIMYICNIII